MKSALKLFSVLMIIGINLSSFQNTATIHARLGTSKYYIDKPSDCIENVEMEKDYENYYEIYPKNHIGGVSSFVFDKTYHSRKTEKTGETNFTDIILDKSVSVQEYKNGDYINRDIEFAVNGEFIWLECSAKTKEDIEKYYAVLKSLSLK
jgi:hypothetical protein